DYIDTWSVGNAVLVFGDTNSRYTRTSDQIGVFASQNGMRDICRGDLGASAMANRAGPEGRQTVHGGVRSCELLQRHLSQQNDSGPAPPAHSGLWQLGGLCAWTLKVCEHRTPARLWSLIHHNHNHLRKPFRR
ncbi:endonuclease/Exonuclease/phosphatase, partial [Colletotrichum cuscutae]